MIAGDSVVHTHDSLEIVGVITKVVDDSFVFVLWPSLLMHEVEDVQYLKLADNPSDFSSDEQQRLLKFLNPNTTHHELT